MTYRMFYDLNNGWEEVHPWIHDRETKGNDFRKLRASRYPRQVGLPAAAVFANEVVSGFDPESAVTVALAIFPLASVDVAVAVRVRSAAMAQIEVPLADVMVAARPVHARTMAFFPSDASQVLRARLRLVILHFLPPLPQIFRTGRQLIFYLAQLRTRFHLGIDTKPIEVGYNQTSLIYDLLLWNILHISHFQINYVIVINYHWSHYHRHLSHIQTIFLGPRQ